MTWGQKQKNKRTRKRLERAKYWRRDVRAWVTDMRSISQ